MGKEKNSSAERRMFSANSAQKGLGKACDILWGPRNRHFLCILLYHPVLIQDAVGKTNWVLIFE